MRHSLLKIVFGSISKESYVEILIECMVKNMLLLYPDGFIFQQDNAPLHKARYTDKWFKQKCIEVIEWPPLSPDLNPIENIWGLMKMRLSRLTVNKECFESVLCEL